ncbi:type III polyketide synthase [Balneola sp. MJW-20]|uniref:type III polyketide synthase n=1 Tax=Gracilimonas aurantiaca TaxID=3234185 RepID=UPI00346612CA
MPAYIHDIVTCTPESFSRQQHIREVMKEHLGQDRKTRAIIHRIYSQSGIEKRHSVIEDFADNDQGSLFFNGQVKQIPDTRQRNQVYETEAKKLFVETGRELLERSRTYAASDITHVITVSCTGFFAPGPEFEIVKQLGLDHSTERYHIGFMGCFAAFPAMKMAASFCKSDPDAVVLLVCTELCTIHFQMKEDIDNLLSGSVFADGAAGMLLSSAKPDRGYKIDHFASTLVTEGEKDMAWKVGNEGFEIILSAYVPEIIENNLSEWLDPLIEKYGLQKAEIAEWAVHPGGRAILDKVMQSMQLSEEKIGSSRKVLSSYGNMSSPTVLFVLKEILENRSAKDEKIMALAFGPGLTVESGLLTKLS